MSARRAAQLWVVQRATAVILAGCVAVHLVTMIYAVRGGLSAGEILGRTRGNAAFGAFYAVFVLAAAAHGAIGLRTIASEWIGWRGRGADAAMLAFAAAFALMGLRAVAAVVMP